MGSLADHIAAGLYPSRPNLSISDKMLEYFSRTFIDEGPPEGVVVADIGSSYTDVLTGISYSKRSGSGNTGWVADVTVLELLANGSSGRELDSAESSSQHLLITAPTDITNLNVQFTVGARPVWVDGFVPSIFIVTAATNVDLQLANTADNSIITQTPLFAPVNTGAGMRVRKRFSTPGDYDVKIRVARLAGTGTISVNAANDPENISSLSAIEA